MSGWQSPSGAQGEGSLGPGSARSGFPLSVLCSGHFGVVRRCRERSSGAFFAAKSVKLRRRKGSRLGLDRAQVEREVRMLRQLQHPHIMCLHEVFASTAEVVLVLEL